MKRKYRKKKQPLHGFIQSGVIFIGDAGYMADNPQNHENGVIPVDPTNPFRDLDKYLGEHQNDHTLELPGSFQGDLLGRGVAVHTNMFSGKYTVTKKICKVTGKLLELKVKFSE